MYAAYSGFPKTRRLLKPVEFGRAFKQGQRLRTRAFTLSIVSNELGYARLGLAVSKKSAFKAADRNRLKRIIRESFRLNATNLRALDIVIQTTQHAKSYPNEALFEKLNSQWLDLK